MRIVLAHLLATTLAGADAVPAAPAAMPTATIGQDAIGAVADLTVGAATQRFRWIAPGTGTIGTAPDDPQRDKYADETAHAVVVTRGLWIADTECTQGLWTEVMGENPSTYRAPDGTWQRLPVHGVSWDDCQVFLERLRERVPGLEARLPTESEWEYAARAGATTALPTGPLTIVARCHGPEIDPIGWYAGNAGQQLELENPATLTMRSPEQYQFPDERRGPHRVGVKAANAWGLHDVIGNVWEWCHDHYAPYPAGPLTDPTGPASGTDGRVYRGGAWSSEARECRLSMRGTNSAGIRQAWFGLRIAVGPLPVAP